jgi:carbamoyltransferase
MPHGPACSTTYERFYNPRRRHSTLGYMSLIDFEERNRGQLVLQCQHDGDSPYMLIVADVAKGIRRPMTPEEQALFGIDKLNVPRSAIPAVTHVDYSARIQTVHAETNPRYHALLARFKAKTACPVLVNTSFNVRGEAIVNSPSEAFLCFMGTEIEVLVVGNCILRKEEQAPGKKLDYSRQFEPD